MALLYEVNYETDELSTQLIQGKIILLRNIQPIHTFRSMIIQDASEGCEELTTQFESFYNTGKTPSLNALLRLGNTVRMFRQRRILSSLLTPLIDKMKFPKPIRLDGGISRLIVSPETVLAAKQSELFPNIAFERETPDGETEIFMPGPANIHRDYNRPHQLFQANMWFPLHNSQSDEVLQIFPDFYHQEIFDMDANSENFNLLAEPLCYKLAFGDAVIFHGEHLHTSPKADGRAARRHSYDFRIAADCADDTEHYRKHFLDIRNFYTNEKTNSINTLFELESACEKDTDLLNKIFNEFELTPFSEDRYLQLAKKCLSSSPALAERVCTCIAEQSRSWYWLWQTAKLQIRLQLESQAFLTFKLVKDFAEMGQRINYMPLVYKHAHSNQPTPEQAIYDANSFIDIYMAKS